MPPVLLLNISNFDLSRVIHDAAAIEAVNPHRGAMRMLDGVIWVNEALTEGVAFKDVRDDEFWVPGHIPGRPIFPGVLMLEAAAQFASYLTLRREETVRFLGFVAADACKFRGQVVPGDRLIILAKQLEYRPGRRFICAAQGLVRDTLVFEGKITGMPI